MPASHRSHSLRSGDDMNPLPTMLRDFAKRALQWADVLEREYEDTGLSVGLEETIHLLETPDHPDAPLKHAFVTADTLPSESRPTPTPTASTRSVPWRRGDYFFCESCGQRKQWFRNTPPWPGAICAPCYNAELARIEAARGRKA